MHESEAIPFHTIGNRRCLTGIQLKMYPHLADFVRRFPESFEHDLRGDVWVFIEPEDS